MRRRFLASLALAALAAFAPAAAAPLDLDDVTSLLRAGVGAPLILRQAKAEGVAFRPGVDAILRLKQSGADDALIEALFDLAEEPSAPAALAPAPAPPEGFGFRTVRETDGEGREVLHVTNLDAGGRRLASRWDGVAARAAATPAPATVAPAEETWRSSPVVVVVDRDGTGTGEYYEERAVSPYMYRDPTAPLYPRGTLPGYYPYWGVHSPGVYPPHPPDGCALPGPHPTPHAGHQATAARGPRFTPIGPASGRESLARMRAQVKVGRPGRR